ncbi:MAG: aldehyde dehydrogenase family protein [Lacisediminihabitans sp.]
MMQVVSPIDASVLAELEPETAAGVAARISAAKEAQVGWARRTATDRGRILGDVAAAIERRATEIAELESRNTGKILSDTKREVLRAAEAFRYYAGWADKVVGETIPVDEDHLVYTLREPYGVVAGIIPWNVPFFFAAKKIAPSLAFGNACVLKPAEDTPLTALLLSDLLVEAGVPENLVQVLVGGREVGAAIVASRDIDLIVFTGSDATGKAIARSAADNLIPIALELGGKSPQVLFADADLDRAIDAVSLGVFASCGQMCIAGSRLIVHESIHREVVDRLSERVRNFIVGNPFESATDIGPQITSLQRDKTLAFIEESKGVGTIVAQSKMPTDPSIANGFFVPPTIFDDLDPNARLLREEVFGPVLAVTKFSSDDEAVQLANSTEFGLSAGIWTSDISRAHKVARAIKAGTVWINTYRILSELVPFGGVGSSGYGRENGTEAARLYTRPKSVWTSLNPGISAQFKLGSH